MDRLSAQGAAASRGEIRVKASASRKRAAPAIEEAGGVDMSAMNEHIGYRIRILQLRIFQDIDERMQRLGMTLGAYTALVTIHENPGVRQGLLGVAMHVKRPNMTKLINGLERAGLVSRSTPPDDKRAVELRLTPSGRERLAQASREVVAHDHEIGKLLSQTERSEMMRLLDRVSEGIDARRAAAKPD